MMDSSFVKSLVELNGKGEVVTTGKSCETSVPGIFAAGDCTDVQFKQTSIAAGEGAKAALQAHRFVTGAKGISIDWGH
ncbi:hypothetical protein HZC09_05350 [Candidatus Micrarchaeota archaeon]|nr:hypothetical protein [Candidatus Micrarchaeota archaeon]